MSQRNETTLPSPSSSSTTSHVSTSSPAAETARRVASSPMPPKNIGTPSQFSCIPSPGASGALVRRSPPGRSQDAIALNTAECWLEGTCPSA